MRAIPLAMLMSALALVVPGQNPPGLPPSNQSAQPPATTGNGAISGVVIDVSTQKPIAGAMVRLSQVRPAAFVNPTLIPPPIPGQLTDAQGRFIFTDLPTNESYGVYAYRSGYSDGGYGAKPPGTAGLQRIALADGQWFRDARIELGKPGSLSGSVTDEAHEPLVGVRVHLYSEIFVSGARRLAGAGATTTDDRGYYRFANLVPGRYLVGVASVQDAAPAGLSTLELTGISAESAASAEAAGRDPGLRRNPALAGDSGSQLIVSSETIPPPASAAGQPRAYQTTFHPSTPMWTDATAIDVTLGTDRQNVDIQLRPVPVFRVSGRLDGPAEAIGGISVRLAIPGADTAGRGAETATALASSTGEFTFLNVPQGTYQLIASRGITEYSLRQSAGAATLPMAWPPGKPAGSFSNTALDIGPNGVTLTRRYSGTLQGLGRQVVTVRDSDIRDLVVPMQMGSMAIGRMIFEFADSRPVIGARVELQPANGDPALIRSSTSPSARVTGASAEFTVEGVLPGLYVVRSLGTIKNVTWNGRDYTNTPLEIAGGADLTGLTVTLTDQSTTVSGTIRDSAGKPSPGAALIAFPVEREQWTNWGVQPVRLRSSAAATSGTFSLRGLPAGDYFVVAVPVDQAPRWRDSTFLDVASRVATRVSLAWNDTKTVDLVLQVIK